MLLLFVGLFSEGLFLETHRFVPIMLARNRFLMKVFQRKSRKAPIPHQDTHLLPSGRDLRMRTELDPRLLGSSTHHRDRQFQGCIAAPRGAACVHPAGASERPDMLPCQIHKTWDFLGSHVVPLCLLMCINMDFCLLRLCS